MLFGLVWALSITFGSNDNNASSCAPNPLSSNVSTAWQIHADWLSCSTQKFVTIGDTTKAKMLYQPPTWKKTGDVLHPRKLASQESWTIVDLSNKTLSMSRTNISSTRNAQAKRTKQYVDLLDCNGKVFAVLELLQTAPQASAPRLWVLDDQGRFIARVHAHVIPVIDTLTYSVFACDGPQQVKSGCPKSNTTKTIEFKSPAVFFVDIWTVQFEDVHNVHEPLATDLRVIAHIAALSASPRGISYCAGIVFALVAIPLCIIAVCLCIFHRRLCCAKDDERKVDERSLLLAGPELTSMSESDSIEITSDFAPAGHASASFDPYSTVYEKGSDEESEDREDPDPSI